MGAGAISTTFWCRRCTEQSRSKRWITSPAAVGQDLHLDVARVDHRLLDEDGRVAEGALGLAHAGLDRLAQPASGRRRAASRAHRRRRPPSRTAGRASPSAAASQRVHVGGRWHAGQGRHAGGPGRRDRPGLVAGQREHLGGGTDEGDPGVRAGLGERRVLRQEAVAGVDRVGARAQGDRDDGVGVEVGAHRVPVLADLVGLVRLEPVLGPAVLAGEDRHRGGAHLVGRTERPDGDLAAVGHEHLGEHDHEASARGGCSSRRRAWGETARAGAVRLAPPTTLGTRRPCPEEGAGMRSRTRALALALALVAIPLGTAVRNHGWGDPAPPVSAAAPAAPASSAPVGAPARPVFPRHLDYVALGDSYSAGPLIEVGRQDPVGCFRSTNNYPAYLAGYFGVRSYRDVTCSGATTDDFRSPQTLILGDTEPPPQLDALSRGTDLVTIGIGGNDFGLFGSLIVHLRPGGRERPAGDALPGALHRRPAGWTPRPATPA